MKIANNALVLLLGAILSACAGQPLQSEQISNTQLEAAKQTIDAFRENQQLKDYFDQSEENTKQINKSNFENKLESIIKQTKDKEIKSELIRTKSILGAIINISWIIQQN